MNVRIEKINPTFIEHEGFYYLEFEGEFYKGCKRCGGEGHYSHNGEHSRCYTCDNTSEKLGEHFEDEAAAKKWCHERALRRAAAERKRAREAAERQQKILDKQTDLKNRDAEVFEFLMAVELGDSFETEAEFYANQHKTEKSAFLRSMKENLVFAANIEKPFTDKMIAAVRKIMEARKSEAANKVAVIDGRGVITGEILSAKVVENDYGMAFKITVKDDRGFRVYGSLAKSTADEAYDEFLDAVEAAGASRYDFGSAVWLLGDDNGKFAGVKGRRITFTATVEASRDDESFGFFSRPTKAAWLAAE